MNADITPFAAPLQQQYGIESASSSVAAQSKATVEARYTIALARPRNMDRVRQTLLIECRRPAFAHNKSAYYRKPIGKGVEGLGIRFVEVALRCMTNVLIETTMIFEDAVKEIHRVTVTDLEANVTYPLDVKVSKTVERSKPGDDGTYISIRKNSYGNLVYTVEGSDDDLLNKRAALVSKAIRTLGLRIIPGDLQDEAEEMIKRIRLDRAAEDPSAERKRIVDGFTGINVRADDLAEYLGHDLGSCSPQELVDLRGLYGAIRDGEATWQSVMANKAEQGSGDDKPEKAAVVKADAAAAKTLPDCDEATFAKKAPGWKLALESGTLQTNALISTIETKTLLSTDQKIEIASWELPRTATEGDES
jgi:hypothetical protein